MTTFRTLQRARKRHDCDGRLYGDCARVIQPGDVYGMSVAPPGSDLGNNHWWRMRLCPPCSRFYRLLPEPEGGTT